MRVAHRVLLGVIPALCLLAAAGPASAQTTVYGTISSDTTWTVSGSPYIVPYSVYVQGSNNPILTIEPGVEIRFRPDTAMYVGYSSTGGLQANGTETLKIRMTSDEPSPAAGDWGGIRIGSQADTSTLLSFIDIEYAGGTASFPGVVYIYNTGVAALDNVTFIDSVDHDIYIGSDTNVTVTNSTLGSVRYAGVSGQTTWTGNTFTDWGSTRSILSPKGADAIGHGNTFLPVPDAVTELLGGNISEDVSLTAAPGPYLVGSSLYVQDNTNEPTLTLEPGVEMQFGPGLGLYAGWSAAGDLVTVYGGPEILLTSRFETPSPGNWNGVLLGPYSTGASSLNRLRIEYAGGSASYPGALYVGSAATLFEARFLENDRHDIYLATGADLDVSGCLLSDFRYEDTNAQARWIGNNFLNWGETVSVLSIRDVEELSHGNVFHPVPGARLELVGNNVSESASWGPNPGPYVPTDGINIQSPSGDPVLTLEPGVVLNMPAGEGIFVGFNYSGALVADGTGNPIILTSDEPVPAAGDWTGVVIYYHSQTGTVLRDVQIKYAGWSASWPGAVFAYYNPGATLDNVFFADNDRHDIALGQNANIAVTGSTLSSIRYSHDSAQATWNGNTFYDWGATTSVVSMLGADEVSHGNLFLPVPDAKVEVLGGNLTEDASWSPAPGPYVARDSLYVQDAINDPTLTLEPGVEMRFGASNGLYAGFAGSGGLVATETLFTSSDPAPAQGDWNGVQVGYYGHGGFAGSTFEYAETALEVQRAGTLSDLRFAHSNVGLYLSLVFETATQPPVSGLRFDECNTAVRTWQAPVRILDSELVGNLWGVDNSLSTQTIVDARDNWWGSPDGPSGVAPGSGAAITEGVLYDPFLTAPIGDCDADGLADTCEVSCGLPGGLCDLTGCGGEVDDDGNGVPDSCDLASKVMLQLTADEITWAEVPPALGYDVVFGDLFGLLASGGDFSLWTTDCMANDYPGTLMLQNPDPGIGEGYFYLLRTEMPGGPESYDVIDGNQFGSRDGEIAGSGNNCP